MGALLAVDVIPVVTRRVAREILGAAGIAMIVASVMLYTAETPFPGVAALLPCVGAGLVIYSGGRDPTLAARVLSLRPIVFTGLISYSLYLWHWPILVYVHMRVGHELGHSQKLLLLIGCFAAAIVSWRFVELPVRRRTFPLDWLPILPASVVAIAACVAFGACLRQAEGYRDGSPRTLIGSRHSPTMMRRLPIGSAHAL